MLVKKNCSQGLGDGSAIAIKKNVKYKIIDDLEERFLALIIQTEFDEICIGTGYQPHFRVVLPQENFKACFTSLFFWETLMRVIPYFDTPLPTCLDH